MKTIYRLLENIALIVIPLRLVKIPVRLFDDVRGRERGLMDALATMCDISDSSKREFVVCGGVALVLSAWLRKIRAFASPHFVAQDLYHSLVKICPHFLQAQTFKVGSTRI